MKRRRLGRPEKNLLIFVIARGLSLAIPLLTLPVLSRAIRPSGFGMLAFAQSIAMYLANVIDFGFNMTSISSAAELREQPLRLRELFWSVTAFRGLLLATCLLMLVPLSWSLGQSLEEHQVIALSALLLIGTTLAPSWLYQGLERGASFAILSLLPRLAIFPLILLFVRQPTDTPLAALIAFGAEFVAGVLLFGYAWFRLAPGRPNASWRSGRAEASRALDAWLGTVLATATANLNPLVLRHLAGLHAVGIFSAADRLVRVIFSFYYPVAHAYQASVTRTWSNHDRAARVSIIRKVMLLFATTSLLFVLGVQICGEWLVIALFGPTFAASATVLRIESLWLVFAGFSTVATYFLYIARHQGRALRGKYALAALVHCVVLVILTHYLAEVGAAIALVAAQAFLAALLWSGASRLPDAARELRPVPAGWRQLASALRGRRP